MYPALRVGLCAVHAQSTRSSDGDALVAPKTWCFGYVSD